MRAGPPEHEQNEGYGDGDDYRGRRSELRGGGQQTDSRRRQRGRAGVRAPSLLLTLKAHTRLTCDGCCAQRTYLALRTGKGIDECRGWHNGDRHAARRPAERDENRGGQVAAHAGD